MKDRKAGVARKTKETDISIELSPDKPGLIKIESGIPFFDHLLNAMAFHGDFSLRVTARGDAEVDPHHMVEDVGLVLGEGMTAEVEQAPGKGHATHADEHKDAFETVSHTAFLHEFRWFTRQVRI